MAYKQEMLLKHIIDNLSFNDLSTLNENIIGLFDSNRQAQSFFKGLFSRVFGYKNLQELDKLNWVCNYPAIDLGDKDARVAFQITTNKTSEKIKDTITRFLNHDLHKEYDRLIIFIIGSKQSTYMDFDTEGKFNFDKEWDIWDSEYLFREINKIDESAILEDILTFLSGNLLEIKFPERLTDNDIKTCIGLLKKDFWDVEIIQTTLVKRDDKFIERKNIENKISLEFFNEKIKWHLSYNAIIFDFLGNEINKNLRNDYFQVCASIQRFYKDNWALFTSFESVFGAIFQKINTYDCDTPGISVKLKIILHNMYFNCDIGTNPDDHN